MMRVYRYVCVGASHEVSTVRKPHFGYFLGYFLELFLIPFSQDIAYHDDSYLKFSDCLIAKAFGKKFC